MSVPVIPDNLRTIASSIQRFSTEFYKSLSKDETKNVVCSPVSVSMTLSMITFGARDKTENELRSSLHLPADDSIAKTGIQSLIEILNNFQQVKINLANKVYVASYFKIKSEFKTIIESYFRSEVENVDFAKPEKAGSIINSWCEEKTNKCIKNIVQPGALSDAVLVLINAIYFKGEWAEPFNSESTAPQLFSVNENVTKEVPMMFTDSSFNNGNLLDLNARYIELPYKKKDDSDATSMYIILPNEINGLKTIEANLEKIDFSKLQAPPTRVMLHLPKFKVESTLDLKSVLNKMGVKEAFEDSANFMGVAEQPTKVSKVIQKAFIEVTEKGTEAGAVTFLKMVPLCLPPNFTVDKPFLCALVVKNTGTPIFIAKVVDPTVIS